MRKSLSTLAVIALCLSGVMLSRVEGAEKKEKAPKNVNRLIHLEAGEAEPEANGIAKISAKMKGAKPKQELMVVGANLKASTTYSLFIDGVKVAEESAEPDTEDEVKTGAASLGAIVFQFSSKAKVKKGKGGPLPLPVEIDPVIEIRLVEIKDAAGAVVLSGEFPEVPVEAVE